MAGHSHWKNIKRTKDFEAKKRSLAFSKIGRAITLSVKEKGGDIEKNPTLKSLIEKAKENNLPKDNIEKAIKKGTGELKGESLESFIFESYGPEGSAIIVEGITNNLNRTVAEFRKMISDYGGKVADPGSVQWLFERVGIIEIEALDNKEEFELFLIEIGAVNFKEKNEIFVSYFKPEETEKAKTQIEKNNNKIVSVSLGWIPKNELELTTTSIEKNDNLFNALESNEDIQTIFSNIQNK